MNTEKTLPRGTYAVRIGKEDTWGGGLEEEGWQAGQAGGQAAADADGFGLQSGVVYIGNVLHERGDAACICPQHHVQRLILSCTLLTPGPSSTLCVLKFLNIVISFYLLTSKKVYYCLPTFPLPASHPPSALITLFCATSTFMFHMQQQPRWK